MGIIGEIPQRTEIVNKRKTILVVDDEEDVCDFFQNALVQDVSDAHFEVRSAFSGDDALRISREFEPDIGIIDIMMPHMDGIELLQLEEICGALP